jgi:hypothetical protein
MGKNRPTGGKNVEWKKLRKTSGSAHVHVHVHVPVRVHLRDMDVDVDMGRFLQLNFRGVTIQDLIVTYCLIVFYYK